MPCMDVNGVHDMERGLSYDNARVVWVYRASEINKRS